MNAIEVTETLVDAQGTPYAAKTVVIETLGTPAVDDSLGLIGSSRINLTTTDAGVLSTSLLTGRYRMKWSIGTIVSEWEFTVPYDGGPYRIRFLGSGDIEAGQRQGWRFAGVNNALLQLRNATTSEWHSITVDASGGAGALTLGIAAAGDTADGPNFRETSDCFQLYAPIGGTWHPIYVLGTDAEADIACGIDGDIVPNNHRIKNGRRQFLNTDTGNYHSLFLTGEGTGVTWALGPGEP